MADAVKFQNYTRMTKDDFKFILDLVGESMFRKDTNYRLSVGVEERLAVTLR